MCIKMENPIELWIREEIINSIICEWIFSFRFRGIDRIFIQWLVNNKRDKNYFPIHIIR